MTRMYQSVAALGLATTFLCVPVAVGLLCIELSGFRSAFKTACADAGDGHTYIRIGNGVSVQYGWRVANGECNRNGQRIPIDPALPDLYAQGVPFK